MRPVRVFILGLGSIGTAVAQLMLEDTHFQVCGAADTDATKAGRDLGLLLGRENMGIAVAGQAEEALAASAAEVVVHATGSYLPQVYDQLALCIEAGKHVVSSCEELAYPWAQYPQLAQELDSLARRRGVRVLGAGVNPGMAMDLLPILAAASTQGVRAIRVRRVVDLGQRRPQLQRKAGLGLSPQEFAEAKREGRIGHVGLRESAHMVAEALGWVLQDVQETLTPVLANRYVRCGPLRIAPGQVVGIRHELEAKAQGRTVLHMELVMMAEPPEAMDAVEVEATPSLRLVVPGGLHGDVATASLLARWAWVVARYPGPAGLLTVRDLPLWPREMEERK